jgi:hypothetical protein
VKTTCPFDVAPAARVTTRRVHRRVGLTLAVMPAAVIAGALAIALALTAPTLWAAISNVTSEQQDTLLSDERWSEEAFGISLRPPLGATLHQATADDAMLRIGGAEGYSIEVYLRRVEPGDQFLQMQGGAAARSQVFRQSGREQPQARVQLDIDTVVTMGLRQVQVAHPSAVLVDRDNAALAGLSAATLYFRLQDAQSRTNYILSHAYVLVDHDSFIMVRTLYESARQAAVRPILEAVLASMQVEDTQKRDAQRRAAIAAGQQAREAMNFQQLVEALPEEQWYRLLMDNQDIGHLQVTRRKARQMGYAGLAVTVRAHARLGGQAVDSLSEMFLAESGRQEVWSTRTTSRMQPTTPGGVPQDMTVVETGVRSGNVITVTREDRGQKRSFEWQTPAEGYLSQAELYLLPALLPRQAEATYGFYAYYPADGQITYRTIQVQPEGRRGHKVVIQPSPNSPRETVVFDAAGAMVERRLPANQRIVPSTRRQILAIGAVRDP